eukprot:2493953-Pleurochrysis_carterae.AAC.3
MATSIMYGIVYGACARCRRVLTECGFVSYVRRGLHHQFENTSICSTERRRVADAWRSLLDNSLSSARTGTTVQAR